MKYYYTPPTRKEKEEAARAKSVSEKYSGDVVMPEAGPKEERKARSLLSRLKARNRRHHA